MKKAFVVVLCAASLVAVLPPARAGAGEATATQPMVDAPRVPGEVVVRFDATSTRTDRASARTAVGAEDHARLGLPGLEVLELDGTSVAAAVTELEARADVLYAEPNYTFTASAIANDPRFTSQWALNDAGDVDIDAPEAWDRATGTGNVTVAVVDTGIAWDHPDLAGNMWANPGEAGASANNGVDDDRNGFTDDVRGWDWVDRDNDPMDVTGHGTHVAGTIGARGNNNIGVAGVGWNMKLMPLRVLSAGGSGSAADIARAFQYAAANSADVVNASLGGPGYSQAMSDAVASNPDVLFVVASGNAGSNNDTNPSWPCNLSFQNLICVTALTRSNTLASFANTGATSVDLAAPGTSIVSTIPHGEVLFAEGFETDVSSRWTTGGSSSWGPETGSDGLGYGDSPTGSYANLADTWLTSAAIDVSGANACALTYDMKLSVRQGDSFSVEVSRDGNSWRDVTSYWGATGGWLPMTEDLGNLLGDSLFLRFALRSDALFTSEGVTIDDISVRCAMDSYSSADYGTASGTSMATPHVAGAAALLFSAAPGSSVTDVRTALLKGTDPVAASAGLTSTGGRLNVAQALTMLIGTAPQPSSPAEEQHEPDPVSPTPSPTADPVPEPTVEPAPDPTAPVAEPIEHDRSLKLRVVRGPRLKGRIDVFDGYKPCVEGARIAIRRNGSFLKTVTAGEDGRFRTRIASRRGTYSARIAETHSSTGHICKAAKASSIQ